ncbi:MAG: T9SS type A sorting domain-containing protein, partial [Bacteroidota bacterium]|nr:T9SS type A sorting domain-containing protein [Bacteroidota bacterium]
CPSEIAITTMASYNAYLTFDNTIDTIGILGLLGAKDAVFRVHVDPETPNGAILVDLEYEIVAGPYEASQIFTERIGLLVEDWETGDFTKFDWVQDGDQPWEITHIYPYEGVYSAKSGLISHGETSELLLTLEIMMPDSISFIRKVSSENYDKLCFFIDNDMLADWSGTTSGWKRQAFAVTPGWHTFKWVYQKNASGSIGEDCAWLDYIIIPSIMTLTCYAGPDDDICMDETYTCSGEATDWVSVTWETGGTGTFNDSTILNPIYTPSQEDLDNGSVMLSLIAFDDEGQSVDDEMILSFIDEPEVPDQPSGPDYVDLRITTSSDYTIPVVPYAIDYSWQIDPLEAGTISSNTSTGNVIWSPTYLGTAMISVKAMNECGESDYSEAFEVTVDNTVGLPEIPENLDLLIYPNPCSGTAKIRYRIQDAGYRMIGLFSIEGRKIRELVHEEKMPGEYEMEIDVSDVPEGVYFFKMQVGGQVIVKKLVKIK